MKANDTQVAGSHYRQNDGVPQHWDLSRIFKWDPMQYQIIKYVMRWKDKHGTPEKRLEDLKKARHFIDKYIEDYAEYDDHRTTPASMPEGVVLEGKDVDPALQARNPDWLWEGGYGDGTNNYKCKHCRREERAFTVQQATERHFCPATAAGPDYVNQDK